MKYLFLYSHGRLTNIAIKFFTKDMQSVSICGTMELLQTSITKCVICKSGDIVEKSRPDKEGFVIYVHYNLFMLFIGHHKASNFTGQVALVSHQAISLARRYAGVTASGACAGCHKKKTFSFLKRNLFVFLEKKRSSIRCRIDL